MGPRYHFKYQIPSVKHGSESIMVCGRFSRFKVEPLIQIEGKMDRFQYRDIQENTMSPFGDEETPLRYFNKTTPPNPHLKLIKTDF